jgi:hypothetical protein
MAGENSAARLADWKQIYDAFERFSHCDDGAIAEGFTESVVHLLATHWETLPQVASLESKNAAFRTFVLRHINDTADTSELKRVARLARTRCPNGHGVLCSAISQAATGGSKGSENQDQASDIALRQKRPTSAWSVICIRSLAALRDMAFIKQGGDTHINFLA